jgi:hypothetical protein
MEERNDGKILRPIGRRTIPGCGTGHRITARPDNGPDPMRDRLVPGGVTTFTIIEKKVRHTPNPEGWWAFRVVSHVHLEKRNLRAWCGW